MPGAVVQTKIGEGAGGATTVATGSFGANVTAGNFLVVWTNTDTVDTVAISINSGTATLGSATQRGQVIEAGTLETLTVFTIPITGTGSLDLLATFLLSQANRQIAAAEISGVSAFDGVDIDTDTGDDPTPATDLSVSVSAQPAFAIAACVDVQGGTPGVGTTPVAWTNVAVLGSAVHFQRVQSLAISATGANTGNFVNGSFSRANSFMVVFTDTPAPPSSPDPASGKGPPYIKPRLRWSGMGMHTDIREWF